MSGQSVPYHLRTNKFVERQLFLDVLDFVRVWNGPSKYFYASMGGRFLEDFRLVNSRFAIEHMISIEGDATTSKRQDFNRLGFIECRNERSNAFVDGFDRIIANHAGKRAIVWLDFADANDRGTQLGEFRKLVSQLTSGDVAKITLNANPSSYRRRSDLLTRNDFNKYLRQADKAKYVDYDSYVLAAVKSDDTGQESARSLTMTEDEYDIIRVGNIEAQLGEYAPFGKITAADFTSEAFASLLSRAVDVAALKGMEGKALEVRYLAAFRYSDAEHQMLTVTCLIADKRLAEAVDADAMFQSWPFRCGSPGDVKEVNVPDVSSKERHFIETLIGSTEDPAEIHEKIPFRFDKHDEKSLVLLSAYLKHYRRYPTFIRAQ